MVHGPEPVQYSGWLYRSCTGGVQDVLPSPQSKHTQLTVFGNNQNYNNSHNIFHPGSREENVKNESEDGREWKFSTPK